MIHFITYSPGSTPKQGVVFLGHPAPPSVFTMIEDHYKKQGLSVLWITE